MERIPIETERQDLFDVGIVITVCVKLENTPPFEALEEAFQKACSLHEVLSSRVQIEKDGRAYYTNGGGNNSIAQTASGLKELIYEQQKIRFRIEDGEFLRAFVSPDGIVFMMHHLAGDGKSLIYFIETFMNCLAGLPCGFTPFRNLTLKDLPKDSRLPFIYKILCKLWNSKWKKDKKIFDLADLDKAYDSYWKENSTCVEIREYSAKETDLLIASAVKAGVSLTAYLVCDMLKDLKGKADVGFAVNGRLDGNRAMGNQATGISIEYGYDPKRSFDDNARKIYKLMQKRLSKNRYRFFVLQFMTRLDPSLKDALNLERAGTFSSKTSSDIAAYLGYGDKVKDLSITNLTRADIASEYGEYKIERLSFIAPVVSYAKNVIGIVTMDGKMTVTRHCRIKN